MVKKEVPQNTFLMKILILMHNSFKVKNFN